MVEAFWFMNYGVRGGNKLPGSQVPPADLDWIRVGVAAARAAHIGNAALRSGKKVTWDDQQQKLAFAE
jgi:hypothetical protein